MSAGSSPGSSGRIGRDAASRKQRTAKREPYIVPVVIHTHSGAALAIHVIARTDDTWTLSATDYETLLTAAEDIGTLRAAEAREAKIDKDAAPRQTVPTSSSRGFSRVNTPSGSGGSAEA